MPRPKPSKLAPRLAVRCDGGAQVGAGHVARCLPLADAFADRGWTVTFVGSYEGFAAWLLDRAAARGQSPTAGEPCGLAPDLWDAAIVDSYVIEANEICSLGDRVPIVTLGEAQRCETTGVLIDYHLDRIGEQPSPRVLPGPAYAPLDPAFAGSGRAGDEVRTVLITVGGSEQALSHIPDLVAIVEQAFPEAQLLVPRGTRLHSESHGPVRMVDLVGQVDLAVTAAGVTAYELACAGVPQVAVRIVGNQRRVINGIRRAGLAPCVELCERGSLDRLGAALDQLRDRDTRRALRKLGMSMFDGRGADRATKALLKRWVPDAASGKSGR